MNRLSPRLQAQVVKEFLSLWRDPKSRFVLIGPPIFQLLIFSYAATLELRHVDLGIYNRDGGRWSHELISRIGAAGFVHELHPVRSFGELQDMLDRRVVLAALDIPASFSRDLAAGHPGAVQVILDGRRANSAQILLGYLNTITSDLNVALSGAGLRSSDTIAERHWFNPNLIYRWFIVPSLGGVLVMFVTLLVTALSIARERELGTFDQLLVSPCTPTEIILAKLVPAVMIATTLGLLMAAAAVFGFGVPFTGSLPLLLGCLVLFVVSNVGLGLMISSICSTQQQAILGTFAVGVPAVLMSGFATPVENMPGVLQWLSAFLPLTHYLIIIQGSFLKALPPAEIMRQAWPMALIAITTLATATIFVRSKLH